MINFFIKTVSVGVLTAAEVVQFFLDDQELQKLIDEAKIKSKNIGESS